MCGGVVINPDGMVHGLKDIFRRVKAEAKKERAAMTKQFRKHAVPRILLGEFGNAFYEKNMYSFGGYQAKVPRQDTTKRVVFQLLSENAAHDILDNNLQHMTAINKQVFGRTQGPMTYPTPELAAFAAINSLIRSVMQDSYQNPWFEDYVVEYPPVSVR